MRIACVLVLCTVAFADAAPAGDAAFEWPAATAEQKPWTYWWWMGSAVEAAELSAVLEIYGKSGLGGVHIIPIYGVKGFEDRCIPYLSPAWMEALRLTVEAAGRAGMGVDMTTGTGWPFGGPNVTPEHAACKVVIKRYTLGAGERLSEKLPAGRIEAVMAFPESGEPLDLTNEVDGGGALGWTPPAGKWSLCVVSTAGTGQNVKRAAPGAEGKVVDPFSRKALDAYLERFDKAFAGYRGRPPRAQYHDSYEYYGADWAPGFLDAFRVRRGYDLRPLLPAFLGQGPEDTVARVKADYRATIADLILEDFIEPWVAWSHAKGCLTRNQAHGSPGNILDLYAASDIPETEIFGPSGFPIPGLRADPTFKNEPPDPLMLKFSSSAAHVAGKRLVSSETCTWLAEHFTVSLAQAKPEIDQLLASGINHVFFHGTTYSPRSEPWPGWLFYASTNFGPTSVFHRDLPELAAYIARCQSILQSGEPDNDVLLYFPIHDVWHSPAGMLVGFGVHNLGQWLHGTAFHRVACALAERGYAFDYVSDRMLAGARATPEGIRTPGGAYRAVLVPACRCMPVETFERLIALARGGATVIFEEGFPRDVPGLGGLEERRTRLAAAAAAIDLEDNSDSWGRHAAVGAGRVLAGKDIDAMLGSAGARREPIAAAGIRFIRRTHGEGHHYFLANLGAKTVEGWTPLGVAARSAVLMDPRFPDGNGTAALRHDRAGRPAIYVRLAPGESRIVRTFATRQVTGASWRYVREDAAAPVDVAGPWRVSFIDGGPRLPAPFETARLASWSALGGSDAAVFAGTARYTAAFARPPDGAGREWILDLGRVGESARVRVNGREVGALWSLPFKIPIGDFLAAGENTLEIEVTNLGANRIADMDRRRVPWKKFYDANIVNIQYKPFDASAWPDAPSGLLGPVRLLPATVVDHAALPEGDAGERIDELVALGAGWRAEVIARVDQSYVGWDVEIGDADNDGANEVLATGCPASRLYLWKKKDGVWQTRLLAEDLARRAPKPGMGLAVRVVDLDGDGKNEVVAGTGQEAAEPAYLHVLATDGTRVTRERSSRPFQQGSAYTHNFGIADIDGDGVKEIVAAYCGSGEVVRYDVEKGLGAIARRTIFQCAGSGEDTCIADVDNDGAVECIICDSYRDDKAAVRIFEFDPKGELVVPCRIAIEGFDGLRCFDCAAEVGDVDNDGRNELIVGWNRTRGEAKGTILAYRVDEGGATIVHTFAREDSRLDLGFFEKMMCIADADNDGDRELIVSTRGERQWGGAGLGNIFMFEAAAGGEITTTLLADFAAVTVDASWIAVGDADNDGKNEIIAATGAGHREKPGVSYVILIEKEESQGG